MKYAVEMDSGAMIYIPSFRGDFFSNSEVNMSWDSQTLRQHGNRITLF
jgi:hypothetical protein